VSPTTLTVAATALGLAFGASASAGNMTKSQYTAARNDIQAAHKSAKAACDPLQANAKDICVAQAKGKEKVALAELGARYKPSQESRYEARVAKGDAEYAVAKERCDDLADNAKDVCRKQAQAAHIAAKADAKAQMKTVEANRAAGEKTAKAGEQATREIAEAHNAAALDKRDAEYAVAKEKCDALAGTPRDTCIADAKARFGRS
jgi:hypothetical protein